MNIENIWFTRKARICASERLLSNDSHSQALIVLYSAALCFVSIVSLEYKDIWDGHSGVILCALSVVITFLSLFLANMNFKSRGLELKNNYIELQHLYESIKISVPQRNTLNQTELDRYTKLLHCCENQRNIDDLCHRVNSRKNLTSRRPTHFECIQFYIYIYFRYAFLIFLYVFPFTMILSVWLKK